MLIRISYSKGTQRIEVDGKQPLSMLYKVVKEKLNLDNFVLTKDRRENIPIPKSRKYLENDNIKHGDMIFLIEGQTMNEPELEEKKEEEQPVQSKEDEIDKILAATDGKIHRNQGPYCRHAQNGKCINCTSLEPYDEQYLEHCDPPIKFMSFHAYLRKMKGHNNGKYTQLESTNCRIKEGCTNHAAWPQGICSKCQPAAVTLDIQKYRHVDNIMFENAGIMNDFLDFWRQTGCQRIGILMGYHTTFDQSPLGIKAVICAIYEPNQNSGSTNVNFVTTDNGALGPSSIISPQVMEVSKDLRLRPIGWIFTDLKVENANLGTVKHYRGTSESYFLSAEECVTAAHLQNMFPNPCGMSSEGTFGSKFVTIVVTGDKDNNIHCEGYQVSNQCMSLVRDNILCPTYNTPELGYIRESSNDQYVPDVLYKQKDKYGNVVSKIGRPLPVEFLIVDMSVAFSTEEKFTFSYRSLNKNRFAIENRDSIKEVQSVENFLNYMKQFNEDQILAALSNLHILSYLRSNVSFQLQDKVEELCRFLRSRSNNEESVKAGVTEATLKEWFELINHIYAANPGPQIVAAQKWSCPHCTFFNSPSASSCEVCGLPPK